MSASPRFAWALNLDAELELERPSFTPSERLQAQLARHGSAAHALLGARDCLATPGMSDPDAFVGRAWCPTPRALSRLRAAGVKAEPAPDVSVLRRVNHRKFAFDLGRGLPDQHYVEERAALDALLARRDHPWLLKRPLAFAGRGQLRIFESVDDKQSAWMDATFLRGGVIVEPLVVPTLEVSVHGFLSRDRRWQLGRLVVQEVSERGVFRAVRLAAAGELEVGEAGMLWAQAERVAAALAGAGYFGPFGIDAYRYRDRSGTGFCSLGEINARYTMGFPVGYPRHPSELLLE